MRELTPHQKTVLQRLIDGLDQKRIAHEMGITESMVKVHCREARKRLGVSSTYQSVALAVAFKWVKAPLLGEDGKAIQPAPNGPLQ